MFLASLAEQQSYRLSLQVLQTMLVMIPMTQLSQTLLALDLMGRLADLHALLAKLQQAAARATGSNSRSSKGKGGNKQQQLACCRAVLHTRSWKPWLENIIQITATETPFV